MYNYILLLSMISLLLSKCGETNIELPPKNLENLTKVAELYKGPCFGKCPVFTLSIYDNGLMVYKGHRNVNKRGEHYKVVSVSEIKELKKAFRQADFWNLQDNYASNIADAASYKISFFEKERSKTVQGNYDLPEPVKALIQKMDEIGNSEGWQRAKSDPSR